MKELSKKLNKHTRLPNLIDFCLKICALIYTVTQWAKNARIAHLHSQHFAIFGGYNVFSLYFQHFLVVWRSPNV